MHKSDSKVTTKKSWTNTCRRMRSSAPFIATCPNSPNWNESFSSKTNRDKLQTSHIKQKQGQEKVKTYILKSSSIIYIAKGNTQIPSTAYMLPFFSPPKQMISSIILQVQPGYSMTLCNFGKQKSYIKSLSLHLLNAGFKSKQQLYKTLLGRHFVIHLSSPYQSTTNDTHTSLSLSVFVSLICLNI